MKIRKKTSQKYRKIVKNVENMEKPSKMSKNYGKKPLKISKKHQKC